MDIRPQHTEICLLFLVFYSDGMDKTCLSVGCKDLRNYHEKTKKHEISATHMSHNLNELALLGTSLHS